LYLDGTKLEANANKNTFVWMRSVDKFEPKAQKKMHELISKINSYLKNEGIEGRISLLRNMNDDFFEETKTFLKNIIDEKNVEFVKGKGKRKTPLQRYFEEFKLLAERLSKYTYYRETAGDRTSFSKVDPSTTYMHMKYDYYCNTGVFKPGYNVQFGVQDGYIAAVLVTPNCNDMKDFIPAVEKYKEMYGRYPKSVPADAGYGSYENYRYCKEHDIELMMKYPTYSLEKKARKKDRFKSCMFQKDEDGTPICPADKKMEFEHESYQIVGGHLKKNMHYRGVDCANCPPKNKCTKSNKGRTLGISPELEKFKEEVRQNLSTKDGQLKMQNRSIYSEGAFGIMKQNRGYDRLRRRGFENVEMEIQLVAIGQNINHLKNRLTRKPTVRQSDLHKEQEIENTKN
jgi:hypothetical protein